MMKVSKMLNRPSDRFVIRLGKRATQRRLTESSLSVRTVRARPGATGYRATLGLMNGVITLTSLTKSDKKETNNGFKETMDKQESKKYRK